MATAPFGIMSKRVRLRWGMLLISATAAVVLNTSSADAASKSRRNDHHHHHQHLHNEAIADHDAARDYGSWENQLAQARALIESGRHEEAEQICRQILYANPLCHDAYALIHQAAVNRPIAADSHSMQSALHWLDTRFRIVETERFVLLSDADERAIQQHAIWMEQTYEQFLRFTELSGLRPLPLQHKLVCVLFDRYDDYRAFARRHDGVMSNSISGYYSPRNDRVVFSVQPDAWGDSRTRYVANGAGEGTVGYAEGSQVPAAGHEHCCPQESAAKCVHETIHQLMFHTRVMAPETQYPLWICEGLSTAFETHAPDQPFGPDHVFQPRQEVFQRLLAWNDLIPLRDLVAMTRLPSSNYDRYSIKAVYHQSYALVQWMFQHRREQMRTYLELMLYEPPGRLPEARHLELFEQAFGDVESLEAEWLRDERAKLAEREGD